MLIRSGTEENLEKKKDLWKYLRNEDIHIYRKLRLGILGRSVNLRDGAEGIFLWRSIKWCRSSMGLTKG